MFRSDLRNLTTRFDSEIANRKTERNTDKEILGLQLGTISDRVEDIANAMGLQKRITDIERLLTFKAPSALPGDTHKNG